MTTLVFNPAQRGVRCDLCGGERFALLHEWPVGDSWNPASVPLAVWRCLLSQRVRRWQQGVGITHGFKSSPQRRLG